MTLRKNTRILTALAASAFAFSPATSPLVNAQSTSPGAVDDDENVVIVTGARIRQGGAQDIKHFRSVSLNGDFLPRAESLTLEGLMGEHDLTLPAQSKCAQLFCLNGYSMAANLPTRPQDKYFVGLGFKSNIDGAKWKREPISLVAVVDRSGSMGGAPIARVKEGLHAALRKMGKGDRLGIVIYGSNTVVHLEPMDVAGNKEQIKAAIDSIAVNGSTYMEAGLKLGYATALNEAAQFDGKTRVMLFTDENANVGRTDPDSFMGMAIAASKKNIGLTTIGVGVHFNDALALKVSSVRGGNLFFVDRTDGANKLFDSEFHNMVSEVAHDINITMTPIDGYAISGVFGVPDGMMSEGGDGAITVTIPSAFLSSNGGGIYASLGKARGRENLPAAAMAEQAPIMKVSLDYVSAVDGKSGRDAMTVAQPKAAPPERLVAAQVLVDEYVTLTSALNAYHGKGDRKGAYELINGLSSRLDNAVVKKLDSERKMVAGLRDRAALVAGYAGEVPKELRPLAMLGKWEVIRESGLEDISRGDIVEFTRNEEMITYRGKASKNPEINQSIELNERQLFIRDANLVMNYALDGDRLSLRTGDRRGKINLKRVAEESEI